MDRYHLKNVLDEVAQGRIGHSCSFSAPKFIRESQGYPAPSSDFSHQGFLASRGAEEDGRHTYDLRIPGCLSECSTGNASPRG
jgi:hypothetical protein